MFNLSEKLMEKLRSALKPMQLAPANGMISDDCWGCSDGYCVDRCQGSCVRDCQNDCSTSCRGGSRRSG